MSLKQFSKEELQETSLIEIAYELLKEKKQAIPFKEIMDEITELLELSEEEVRARIAQFYTDLNIDGRFMSQGENRWGLRVWYPVDQTEEETVTQVKPKKKKKVADDEDLDIEEYDELEEDDIDYDDVDDFDDVDELDEDDDDDDLLEEDLDADDDDDFEEDEEVIEDEDYDLDDEEDDEDEDDFDAEDEEDR
ncbi:DNA-directed RNA polymerase subunit delta [Bacillus sp. 31A1R]|uniref:Probable DNA-directed RNA polymerase subunit delta n=1 Tax=Robertmurraya mangrovi TaxID=3098077 RepID=A0ABU5IX93_9BACI|nr:DNA-directed RNA polymerase subunit delta [Bacillus sp. 31A1R]MDZ5471782.1 DNA-directed RNA polymerase subunit delta [Bacillus sp. 31A1R]